MVLDIDKVCRLCSELPSNSIFNSDNSSGHHTTLNDDLISRILECTALKVASGDGLPECVCESCIRLVDKFLLFRKMCWEVDSKLRQYLFSEKDKNEQFSALPNPVRLDSDRTSLPVEAKTPWICDSTQIKGELETSDDNDDDTVNGNSFDDIDSEEDYHPRSSKSPAKLSSNQTYSCDNCDESFRTLSELKTHKEEEQASAKKTKPVLVCDYCNKSFKQLKRYKDHLKTHDQPEEGGDERSEESQKAANDSDSEPLNQRTSARNRSRDKKKTVGTKKKARKAYDCEYCDQVFNSYAKFTLHELTHTGEKKYNCSDCSRSFTHKHSLIGHIKEQHTGEVNFTCDVCGRGFVHQSTFNIHKKTHSTEKPLKCPDCDKCFTQMKNLRVHRQIHSASRSHTCQVCGKSFNFMKTLKVHLILHTGEKPYVCTYCGKAFAQSAPLKTHTRIHTGEKPYHCTICPLKFSTNNSLKSHILKHSGEAPYCCEVCSKGFTRKKDMVKHQEETHRVFIGVPEEQNQVQILSQNDMPNQVIVHQQGSLPPLTPLTPVPSMLIVPDIVDSLPGHISSSQIVVIHSPPPLAPLSSPHLAHAVSPHLTEVPHLTPNQLESMTHHSVSPHAQQPIQNCLPHYEPPQNRTDVSSTDCSGG